MDVRSAKDLLHIRQWLNLMQAIVDDGREHYLNDPIATGLFTNMTRLIAT
jgi:hypothetical protein